MFVDEEYNFAIGKYLLRNEVLYDDIITNHQPITHILSYAVQKFTNPNSTFLLVVRHREFIIVWSILWSLVLIQTFGLGALIFVIIYELTKSYLFGNLFLAESLVIYPILFLIGIVINEKKKLNHLSLIFCGICIALSAFLLGPIWPVLGFLTILLLYTQKDHFTKSLVLLFLGMLTIILPICFYASVNGYFEYYLFYNLIYTVPNYQNEPWAQTLLKSFCTPVLSFLQTNTTPALTIIRTFSLLMIINMIFLISKRKSKLIFTIILLLGLANIRFVPPGNQHYRGFHLLPWYSILIFITSIISIKYLRQYYYRILCTILIITAVALSLEYSGPVLFDKKDMQKDYLINYSTHTDRGEIIRILSNPKDTLFVSPDAWIVYWQSNTNHLPKLFGYYPWMSGIPKLHSATLYTFTKIPPTFIYCDNCIGLDLEIFLSNYIEIKKSGERTRLYVLNKKVQTLTKFQIDRLEYYGVKFK